METKKIESVITDTVEAMCSKESFKIVSHEAVSDVPMPSIVTLGEIVDLIRSVIFPGYFGFSDLKPSTMKYYTGTALDKVSQLLTEQIKRGFCFYCNKDKKGSAKECENIAKNITIDFLTALPEIRELLASDVLAAFEGDPAAESPSEAIFCYPSIKAMTNIRIAQKLFKLGVPLIPRIITEIAHSNTGIDIHPGAEIGAKFFIDHGTGVVIGGTSIIGNNVRLYQGVTLGAKSFPLDKNGNPIKGIPRHPIVEDDVIIYAGTTILGRITIGKGSVIGGNLWITENVPPGSKMLQAKLK